APNPTALQLHMGQLQADFRVIRRGTSSPTALVQSRETIGAVAKDMIQRGEMTRNVTGPAIAAGLPQAQWTAATDAFIAASIDLERTARNPKATMSQVRKSIRAVQSSCTDCHASFRLDQ